MCDTGINSGLTKREYFAGLAMQGWMSSNGNPLDHYIPKMAAECVAYADALLEELAK
jgi:hypothetical protein